MYFYDFEKWDVDLALVLSYVEGAVFCIQRAWDLWTRMAWDVWDSTNGVHCHGLDTIRAFTDALNMQGHRFHVALLGMHSMYSFFVRIITIPRH